MTDRAWAGEHYSRLYHSLVERMGGDFDDPAFVGSYVKLLMTADAAYPTPAPLPRWLDDVMLDRLVDVDLVRRIGRQNYTIAGLAKEREGRASGRAVGGKARSNGAARDRRGRFTVADPQRTQQPDQQPDQQPQQPPATSIQQRPAVQLEQEQEQEQEHEGIHGARANPERARRLRPREPMEETA